MVCFVGSKWRILSWNNAKQLLAKVPHVTKLVSTKHVTICFVSRAIKHISFSQKFSHYKIIYKLRLKYFTASTLLQLSISALLYRAVNFLFMSIRCNSMLLPLLLHFLFTVSGFSSSPYYVHNSFVFVALSSSYVILSHPNLAQFLFR